MPSVLRDRGHSAFSGGVRVGWVCTNSGQTGRRGRNRADFGGRGGVCPEIVPPGLPHNSSRTGGTARNRPEWVPEGRVLRSCAGRTRCMTPEKRPETGGIGRSGPGSSADLRSYGRARRMPRAGGTGHPPLRPRRGRRRAGDPGGTSSLPQRRVAPVVRRLLPPGRRTTGVRVTPCGGAAGRIR